MDVFHLLKTFTPAYTIESIKLFKLVLFNYLFSNGDAHFKNFSLIETPFGDFKLSPAYDLLNSGLHIDDNVFALTDGLLPPPLVQGKTATQFFILGEQAKIHQTQIEKIFSELTSKQDEVLALIGSSFLNEESKNNYTQTYQKRLKKLIRS